MKMAGLGRRFHSEENHHMVVKELDKYALDSVEAAYEDPREYATMGLMAS